MPHVTRKKNGHLIEITRDDGTKDISWDWNQLLADVKAAIAVYEDKHVHAEDKPKKAAAKKPAAKKPAAKAPAKKPAAKKPAAKKAAAKKPAAKKSTKK